VVVADENDRTIKRRSQSRRGGVGTVVVDPYLGKVRREIDTFFGCRKRADLVTGPIGKSQHEVERLDG
jgi:hypothetical protein